MTKHATDSPDGPALTNEDITPEMIEAGRKALGESGIVYDMEATRDEKEAAIRSIFVAMASSAPKSR